MVVPKAPRRSKRLAGESVDVSPDDLEEVEKSYSKRRRLTTTHHPSSGKNLDNLLLLQANDKLNFACVEMARGSDEDASPPLMLMPSTPPLGVEKPKRTEEEEEIMLLYSEDSLKQSNEKMVELLMVFAENATNSTQTEAMTHVDGDLSSHVKVEQEKKNVDLDIATQSPIITSSSEFTHTFAQDTDDDVTDEDNGDNSFEFDSNLSIISVSSPSALIDFDGLGECSDMSDLTGSDISISMFASKDSSTDHGTIVFDLFELEFEEIDLPVLNFDLGEFLKFSRNDSPSDSLEVELAQSTLEWILEQTEQVLGQNNELVGKQETDDEVSNGDPDQYCSSDSSSSMNTTKKMPKMKRKPTPRCDQSIDVENWLCRLELEDQSFAGWLTHFEHRLMMIQRVLVVELFPTADWQQDPNSVVNQSKQRPWQIQRRLWSLHGRVHTTLAKLQAELNSYLDHLEQYFPLPSVLLKPPQDVEMMPLPTNSLDPSQHFLTRLGYLDQRLSSKLTRLRLIRRSFNKLYNGTARFFKRSFP